MLKIIEMQYFSKMNILHYLIHLLFEKFKIIKCRFLYKIILTTYY